MSRFQVVFMIAQCISVLYSWDISNSNRNDVILRHVSLYYLRAFLCVQSAENSTVTTLVESTWPENIIAIKPKAFPNSTFHLGRNKKDCEKIHQALSSDVDGNGYLWVLDIGSEHCPAKIIIFDLENKNTEACISEQRHFSLKILHYLCTLRFCRDYIVRVKKNLFPFIK